ncbi:hypothetical protein AKJ39_01670 [candidate division MSBL1 archaeon SCGC-AAA259J03]|uniref:Radical SAM core domain-containing protein n=1 Tax=candidate division MSBL1 archaeon SCGC-AAA259J03 TaxID=1698269 RepID=A0A656YX92_9EURY|nr:hypothetical protein AKJ39_01670 [candidate division MSBL1 archaeon SCGC-AAA259J03]
MDEKTLKIIISKILKTVENPVFSWQGGEPTLVGLCFFKKIIELQKKYGFIGQKISNSIQTNGVLLDKKWADFFLKYNFFVGLSLDGPKKIHNEYRIQSWDKAMKAGKILNNYGIPHNILCVLTKTSVEEPEKLLDFYLENNHYHLQFIPAFNPPSGKSCDSIQDFSPDPYRVGNFWHVLFQKWTEQYPPEFSVRFFDSLLRIELGKKANNCRIEKNCKKYLLIESNGDIYPCDFFVEPEKKLGNIKNQKLSELAGKEKYDKFAEKKQDMSSECIECEYKKYCNGGCPRYRDLENYSGKKTYLCKAYRYFLDRNKGKIENVAQKAKKYNNLLH